MPGVPSPSSVDGLEIQKKETLAEIQKCKNNLAALNDTYAALSKKQQLARERECNSPTQNRDLLKELLKHPKRRTIGSCTNGKDRSKANREQSLSGDEVLEEFSKIRMVNVQIPPSEFHDRMKNRRFIKMDEIERSMVDGDIPGDFVIIGILVHQKVVQCEDTTVKALVLTDLHQNYLRLFLVERALEKQYEDGSLVAILNPQILMPSKRSALIGLVIDSSALFIKLGTSSDHGWCNASGKSCRIIVNTTREAYCTDHRMEMYHSARIQRQEFAGGLNPVQQGAPNDNIKKKQCNRVLGCVAHYNIRSLVLATDTLNCTLKEKPKPTSQQCTTQELEVLKRSNLPGAKNIRLHFGVKELEVDVNVFGAESLARMGCNPFNKNDAIPSAKITPKKNILEDSNNQGTPTKVGKRQSHLMNGPNTTKKGKIEETIELICSDSD